MDTRTFTITLTAPDEDPMTRTVTRDELAFALHDLVAGELPDGVELTVAEAHVFSGQPLPIFATQPALFA